MSLLHLAFAAVVVVVIVVVGLVYWHESRRPEVRPRPGGDARSGPDEEARSGPDEEARSGPDDEARTRPSVAGDPPEEAGRQRPGP